MQTLAIGGLAILLYLVGAVMIIQRLRHRQTTSSSKWKALTPGAIAVLLHCWVLSTFLYTSAGLNLSLFNALSLIAWLISVLLILSATRHPTENLALAAFPLGAFSVFLELLIADTQGGQQWEGPLQIHILISIIAYSLLSIAAVQAVLLAIQDKHLRNKQPGGFIRTLPPLQTMEALLFQMIGLGFALQTLSLLTGFMFLENMFAQHLVHKTALSMVAWLFFAVLLWGRWRFGWRGRTAIRWTLSGFFALVMSYIGSKFVLEMILGRT